MRARPQPSPAAPNAFFVVAFLAGVCLTNTGLALPLLAIARGYSASTAGDLLAGAMIAVALGALGSGPLVSSLGPRHVLAGGLALVAIGETVMLAWGADLAAIALAAMLWGAGLGCFWVGSQATLGQGAGGTGAERGFVRHYTWYVAGSALGAPATGALADLARSAGASYATSMRLAFALGLGAALSALAALALSSPSPRPATPLAPTTPARSGPVGHGLALQLPDLLLVAAVALLTQLAPVILARDFRFSPAATGAVVGALAAAKITGSLTAGAAARRFGSQRAIGAMLALAAAVSLLLVATSAATLYVVLLFVAVFGTTGAWPVVVEAAFARVRPRQRHGMAVAWNAREYAAIGAATAAGGWLLTRLADPRALYVVAGALLGAAAAVSRGALRRPVHAPGGDGRGLERHGGGLDARGELAAEGAERRL